MPVIFLSELFTLIQSESFYWLPKTNIWDLVGEGVIDTTLFLKICPDWVSGRAGGSCCCPGWSCRDEEMSDSRVGLPRALRFFYWQCPPPEQQCVPISAVCPQQQFVQLSLGCPLDDGAVPQTLCWVRLFQGNSTAPTVQPARLCWGKNKNHRLYPP